MSYRVEIAEPAESDYWRLRNFIAANSSTGAAAWDQAFADAVERLQENPHGYSLAPEDEDHHPVIRQFFFKTRRGLQYRGLITVVAQTVHILHVRGPGQNLLPPADVRLPENQ